MKIKFLSLNIIFLILIFTQSIYALQLHQNRNQHRLGQNRLLTIKGNIEDWEHNPVIKALVLIPEISKSTETDGSGNFEITQIPSGKYHIEVFAEGYIDYSSGPFVLKQNKLNYKVILIKKITKEIVVTATRTPKLFDETPVKTEVITATEIEKKGATNLAETLSQTTGVRVENNCQNCNFTQVRINGMEGKYTQILIDSSPVISAMTGVYGLEQIPTEMLDSIEIVKGGGSSLYGSNAVAGVINVLTKEPQENKTTFKLHQESSSGKPFTNLGFHSSLVSKDLYTKAFLFATYQKREPVDLNEDSFSELGTISNTSFGLNFYNYFSRIKGHLKLGFFRIFEERRGGDLFNKPPHEANTAEWIKTDQIGVSSEWNQFISDKIYCNLSFSLIDAKRNTYYGSHKDINAYGNTKNPLLFLNYQFNYKLGNHFFSLGAQYKKDKIKDEATGYNRIIEDVYHESGFFIQDDFNLGSAFSLLTGLRLNKHSALDKIIVTPRLSFLLKIIKDLSFRASFSTGFRAPQVFDEDLHITQVGGEGMMITNSPNLKEEKSYSISSGLDYGKQIKRSLIQFSIEAFYTKLNDTFVLHEVSRIENARILERINGAGSRVYGFSFEFGLVLGPRFNLTSGWTIQRSNLDEPEPDFNSKEFFRTPNYYGYANISYENNKLVNANLSIEYTGEMKVPHYAGYIKNDKLETTDAFWVMNTKLRKPVNFTEDLRISVFFGVHNILNSYQKDLDKSVDRDSGYVYGPAKPRSFYAGFKFSF
ncbi:MAG: TonB-dependent receptor [Candidatus Aminicenantes bacterium]|nr:TonB-dependent receptor [Candidatus Aminicenantes bacterium]MBL7082449.1 TonB-dependent receptor [Candidatus Aminicenantes bacterium]